MTSKTSTPSPQANPIKLDPKMAAELEAMKAAQAEGYVRTIGPNNDDPFTQPFTSQQREAIAEIVKAMSEEVAMLRAEIQGLRSKLYPLVSERENWLRNEMHKRIDGDDKNQALQQAQDRVRYSSLDKLSHRYGI